MYFVDYNVRYDVHLKEFYVKLGLELGDSYGGCFLILTPAGRISWVDKSYSYRYFVPVI